MVRSISESTPLRSLERISVKKIVLVEGLVVFIQEQLIGFQVELCGDLGERQGADPTTAGFDIVHVAC